MTKGTETEMMLWTKASGCPKRLTTAYAQTLVLFSTTVNKFAPELPTQSKQQHQQGISIRKIGTREIGMSASKGMGHGSSKLPNVDFRVADIGDFEEVNKLMYESFHSDEPMSKVLGMFDGIHHHPVLDQFVYDIMKENLTIIAVDREDNQLAGAAINTVTRKTPVGANNVLQEAMDKYRDSRFINILKVINGVNVLAGDIYTEMGVDEVFDITMLAVSKTKRKAGLAKELLKQSLSLAREKEFKAAKAEATGFFSRKAFLQLGFDIKAELAYADYKDEDGNAIFASIVEPHRCTTLVTKHLTKE